MKSPLFSFFPSLPPPVDVRLVELPGHSCSYLPGRAAKTRAFRIDRLPPTIYRHLMDRAFRRSGKVVYQPICPTCRACQPIRLKVDTFAPTRSQRRCRSRNSDLLITCDLPAVTNEKFELYQKYLVERHRRKASGDASAANEPDAESEASRESFQSFLYDSPTRTLEFAYRDPQSNRLLAIGIVDDCGEAWSSVYSYFDPAEARRSLGTFGILHEIAAAALEKVSYYYLGYWVQDAPTMKYKAGFGPHEVLDTSGVWQPTTEE